MGFTELNRMGAGISKISELLAGAQYQTGTF